MTKIDELMLHDQTGYLGPNYLLQKPSIFLYIFTYSSSPISYLSKSLTIVFIRPEFAILWGFQWRVLNFLISAQKGSVANIIANSNKQCCSAWSPIQPRRGGSHRHGCIGNLPKKMECYVMLQIKILSAPYVRNLLKLSPKVRLINSQWRSSSTRTSREK